MSAHPDIRILSFGFKYGPPPANNWIDVSFLPNPGRKFGLESTADHRHREILEADPQFAPLIDALDALATVLIEAHDRPLLAIGCSSGRHRSPIVAEHLAERLRARGYVVDLAGRDESAQ